MLIREVEVEDAKKYLKMLKSLDSETNFMMYETEERETKLEEQIKIIENKKELGDPLFLAEVDGEIVGFLGGTRGRLNRERHSLYIALGVLKKYRGNGIGKMFMREVDNWALENNVSRVELTVMCTNDVAVNLYEGMGYEIEGRKKGSLIVDGKYIDEYCMGKRYSK